MAQIDVGIEWGTCFCDCYHFNLGIGYEFHYYWDQMQIPYPGIGFPSGDLGLHGLNVSVRFDF